MSERKHDMEIEIAATPAEVWQALSTAEGFASWFAPLARVEPGVGGAVSVAWVPGMEGSERIEAWEPEAHLRLAHDRAQGAPPSVVDYLLEGRAGTTVLRMVHSGFTADASFDNEFEATRGAWPAFLQLLKHSVERGIAACRNVTVFRMPSIPRDAAWAKLMGPQGLCAEGTLEGRSAGDSYRLVTADGEVLEGAIKYLDPAGYACLQSGDAVLGMFCEKCGGSTMLTLMWLLYDVSAGDAAAVDKRWSALLDGIFGQAAAAAPIET